MGVSFKGSGFCIKSSKLPSVGICLNGAGIHFVVVILFIYFYFWGWVSLFFLLLLF